MCYNCGKPGHKRPYCPQNVNRVASYNKINLLSLQGAVGNNKCILTLDSGAQITVVNGSLVNNDEYTGESIKLIRIGGHVTIAKLAVVKFKTEKFTFPQEVAVIKTSNQEVLIGLHVVHLKELWRIACIAQKASVNVSTRAQTDRITSEEPNDQVLSELDGVSPDSIDLLPTEEKENIAEIESETDDSEVMNQTLLQNADENVSSDSNGLARDIYELEDTGEWPLPSVSDQSDKEMLIAQQNKDPTLEKIRN